MSYLSTGIITIREIANLPVPAHDGETIMVDGYHDSSEFPAVTYRWDAISLEEEDGGLVIKPGVVTGAGRWLMVWDHSRLRPEYYGAKGYPIREVYYREDGSGKWKDVTEVQWSTDVTYLLITVRCSSLNWRSPSESPNFYC